MSAPAVWVLWELFLGCMLGILQSHDRAVDGHQCVFWARRCDSGKFPACVLGLMARRLGGNYLYHPRAMPRMNMLLASILVQSGILCVLL